MSNVCDKELVEIKNEELKREVEVMKVEVVERVCSNNVVSFNLEIGDILT